MCPCVQLTCLLAAAALLNRVIRACLKIKLELEGNFSVLLRSGPILNLHKKDRKYEIARRDARRIRS